jgi:hypothetical protein
MHLEADEFASVYSVRIPAGQNKTSPF